MSDTAAKAEPKPDVGYERFWLIRDIDRNGNGDYLCKDDLFRSSVAQAEKFVSQADAERRLASASQIDFEMFYEFEIVLIVRRLAITNGG